MWWTWTSRCRSCRIIGGLSGAALQSTKQGGRDVSKGVLTAMSVKIPITKLLKMVYTTSEASVITGAMAVAMWKLLNASYILGRL
jgi:hypothetical protein